MFSKLFGRKRDTDATLSLYSTVVEQSRQPVFYVDYAVPDSVDGRFDMISLHMFFVLRRLKGKGEQANDCAQALFDLMFRDMDLSMREMGAGDLGVGKRVKAMAEAFYGRIAAYDSAIESDGDMLPETLRRNLYGTVPSVSEAALEKMADYVRRQDAHVQQQALEDLMAGQVSFLPG